METLPENTTPAVKPKRKYNYTVKTGRPTKYKPEYCQAIVEYFDVEPYRKEVMAEKHSFTKDGRENATEYKYQLVPNRLPTLFRFAQKIGVETKTLNNWAAEHPDFLLAFEKCKELQKEFLINTGMSGASNAAMTIFTAKNITDMRNDVPAVQVQHQVFFMPREIAQKYNLNLPEGDMPQEPVHLEATVLPPAEEPQP